MSKINAVPYTPHSSNPNAVPAHARHGAPDGFVPYISWTDGAPDIEDTDLVYGVEEDDEEDEFEGIEKIAVAKTKTKKKAAA